jgi:hypothetical protein
MNRKGGAMVEAALVFPLVILSLMTIIAILMFLFEEAAAQSELHLVIRTEAGRANGTFNGKAGSSNASVYKGIKGIHSVMKGNGAVTFEKNKILPWTYQKPITGYQYLTDERKYIRYIDFFTQEEKKDGENVEASVQ